MNVSSLRFKTIGLLVLGSMLGLVAAKAADGLDSLLTRSPFGTAPKGGQNADGGNQAFELRGVMEENGLQVFSIFDTATKRSRWVTLNDTSGDLVIKSYDAEARTVSLDQNGRTLALTLKSGPKIAQSIPSPMAPTMQPGANGMPGQILPNGVGKGPEAQRLQQIAEEIRRRRALRQQPPQQQMQMPSPNMVPGAGGPTPMPGSGNGPMPNSAPTPGANYGPMPMPNAAGSSGPMPIPAPKS